MRVLIIARELPPEAKTGRSAAFARLIGRLSERHEVRLVAGYRESRAAVPSHALGVPQAGHPTIAALSLWRAARAAVRRHDPAVVVTQGWGPTALGRPTVAVVRDLVGTGWQEPAALLDPVKDALARRVDAVVAPTQATRAALRAAGVGKWQLHVIPEVLEPAELAPVPPEPPTILVHPGRVLPGKGQHLSVDAVSRLPAAIKARLELHVAGPAGDARYLHQLKVAARGQPVIFHDDDAAMTHWLDRAHLALYPTAVPEGFADALAAAAIRGVPALWADHDGVRETTGGWGIPILPDSAEAVRDAILVFLADPAGWKRSGTRARDHLLGAHHPALIDRRWDALLSRCAR